MSPIISPDVLIRYRDHLLRLRGAVLFELHRAMEKHESKLIGLATAQIDTIDMVIRDYERLVLREAPLPTAHEALSDFIGELS